jgi:predicted RNA-binding Zn ribbon-like protein
MAKIKINPKGWKLVGGRLCLDFINTVGGRAGATVLQDKLIDYADLLEWAQFAGFINPTESRSLARHAASDRHAADATLARAVVLREVLYRIFKSTVKGRRPRSADLDMLSGELRLARARERLTHTRGAFGWAWEDCRAALDRVLWPVSLSAADVLTSKDLSQLRQCAGDKCGWLFLDTSRNRSRHWCDMKDCGNRAKVRRFRTRQQRNHGHLRSA